MVEKHPLGPQLSLEQMERGDVHQAGFQNGCLPASTARAFSLSAPPLYAMSKSAGASVYCVCVCVFLQRTVWGVLLHKLFPLFLRRGSLIGLEFAKHVLHSVTSEPQDLSVSTSQVWKYKSVPSHLVCFMWTLGIDLRVLLLAR